MVFMEIYSKQHNSQSVRAGELKFGQRKHSQIWPAETKILVLLSALVERFLDSRMRGFFKKIISQPLEKYKAYILKSFFHQYPEFPGFTKWYILRAWQESITYLCKKNTPIECETLPIYTYLHYERREEKKTFFKWQWFFQRGWS